MKRDEHGRKPGDPLYGKAQPRNVNEIDFDVLETYLDEQAAPAEVRSALAALRERWALGRKMSQQLRARNRKLERMHG